MKELTYFQKLIAQLVGTGIPDSQILARYQGHPWRLTKGKLRRWKSNELFKAEAERVLQSVEEKLVNSKARLSMLVADRVLTIMEDELNMRPYNPETGEGNVDYNRERQLKYGLKLLEELGLGKRNDLAKDTLHVIFEQSGDEKVEEKEAPTFNPKWLKDADGDDTKA